MELIRRWLKGNRSYIVGRVLYSHFESDVFQKNIFSHDETVGSKEKLVAAIEKILDASTSKIIQPEETNDPIIIALDNEWMPLYQRMNLLRHKLDEFDNDNCLEARTKCKELCGEILEIEQQVMAIWTKKDYYMQHRYLPEMNEEKQHFVIPQDPLELAKLINNLKKYIRKYKKCIRDNPDKPLYAALLKKYEEQLEQINSTSN